MVRKRKNFAVCGPGQVPVVDYHRFLQTLCGFALSSHSLLCNTSSLLMSIKQHLDMLPNETKSSRLDMFPKTCFHYSNNTDNRHTILLIKTSVISVHEMHHL